MIAEVTVSVVMKARTEAMKLSDVLEVNIVDCAVVSVSLSD